MNNIDSWTIWQAWSLLIFWSPKVPKTSHCVWALKDSVVGIQWARHPRHRVILSMRSAEARPRDHRKATAAVLLKHHIGTSQHLPQFLGVTAKTLCNMSLENIQTGCCWNGWMFDLETGKCDCNMAFLQSKWKMNWWIVGVSIKARAKSVIMFLSGIMS